MQFLSNLWWYLVLIGVMILIHELGHYWAARFFDVKVETFSFGFGPRLFGVRRGETDFRFSAILFGGYVRMLGEQPGDEGALDPRSLLSKPRWQRTIIAFAGPGINIVLGIAILTGLFMERFPKVPTPPNPYLGQVAPDGAAYKAGLRVGDRIVQIDDQPNPTWEDVAMKEIAGAKRAVDVWAERDGQRMHFSVTPTLNEKQGVGDAGWEQETDIELADVKAGMDAANKGLLNGDILVSANGEKLRSPGRLPEIIKESAGKPVSLVWKHNGETRQAIVNPSKQNLDGQERWMIGVQLQARVEIVKLGFFGALAESWKQNLQNAQMIFKFLEGIVERRMSARSLEGPIRIAQLSGEAAREGPATFLGLMAAVSLNLAIFNLLPIPILDGGVMLMLFVEMLLRRDVDLKIKEAVLKVGFVFLMMVVAFVLYNDISKILPAG